VSLEKRMHMYRLARRMGVARWTLQSLPHESLRHEGRLKRQEVTMPLEWFWPICTAPVRFQLRETSGR
jgi:hypothetical protein